MYAPESFYGGQSLSKSLDSNLDASFWFFCFIISKLYFILLRVKYCLSINNLVLFVSSQAEWEALEIVQHEWSLEKVEEEMMEDFSPTDIMEDIAKDKYVW